MISYDALVVIPAVILDYLLDHGWVDSSEPN